MQPTIKFVTNVMPHFGGTLVYLQLIVIHVLLLMLIVQLVLMLDFVLIVIQVLLENT